MPIHGLLRRWRGGSFEGDPPGPIGSVRSNEGDGGSDLSAQATTARPLLGTIGSPGAVIDACNGERDIHDLTLPPGTMANGVLVGKENFLFLAGGAHAVFEIVNGLRAIDERSVDRFRANVSGRAEWAARRGIPYVHLVFPDKQSIIPHLWPFERCLRMGELYLDRWANLRLPVLYPDALLRDIPDQALSRVDTHVTPIGSIHVASEVAARLTGERDEALVASLLDATRTTRRHSGDLGAKLNPSVSALEPVFATPPPGRFLTNGIEGGNNGLVDLRFNPDAGYQKRCVVFGDSFGRDICVYLQFWFEEVFFLRTGFFHADLAARLEPDLLVTENVERYLDDCRDDAEAPDFDLYRARKEATTAPSDAFRIAYAAIVETAADDVKARSCSARVTAVGPSAEATHALSVVPEMSASGSFASGPLVSGRAAIPVATRPAPIGGETVIEAAVLVPRTMPLFVVDQSATLPPWSAPAVQDIHSTLHAERRDVLLFGPSIQVLGDTWWSESREYGEQFLDMVASDSYRASFPGPLPHIERVAQTRAIDFGPVVDAIECLDERLFLATPLEPANWGRWISTVIAKVDHFRQFGEGRRLLCVASLPWQRALLARLGVEPHEVLPHDPGRTYRCRDLASVEYNVTNMTVSAAEARRFRHLRSECTARARSANGAWRPSEKIFVSRLSVSARNPHYRALANERTLSDALEARGYQVIEPETLSFDQQVAAFGNARLVVCVGGAAVYNAVFCGPETWFVSLESSDAFLGPHTSLLSSLGLRYGIIVGTQDAADPTPVHKTWTVDVDDILARLSEIGG